jgi:hypothetical protein
MLTRSITRAVVALLAVAAWSAAPANAEQPVFPVMNTSEEPPDGVWFRTAADPGQTTRTDGVGIYAGEHLRVRCFAVGTPFGPHHNDIWYYAVNVERPTAAGRSNEGWMNTHYVDDGMTADNPHPSVPRCARADGNGDAPVRRAPAAMYFSPYDGQDTYRVKDGSTIEVNKKTWWKGCGGSRHAYDIGKQALGGRPAKTLAGWSAGRLGVLFFLKHATDDELRQLRYVLLIDPGDLDIMTCDSTLAGGGLGGVYLARWLSANPNAHLVVISASWTRSGRSKGIQEVYFNPIRDWSKQNGSKLERRVLTCNYTMGHDPYSFTASRYWIAHEIGRSACPRLRENGRAYPGAGWHP